MTTAQRRIVTRTLFSLAALCCAVAAGFSFVVLRYGTEPFALVFAIPPAAVGLVVWVLGAYVRAGESN